MCLEIFLCTLDLPYGRSRSRMGGSRNLPVCSTMANVVGLALE